MRRRVLLGERFARPGDAAPEQIVKHRQIPGAAIDRGPPVEHRLQIIMAATVAERQVQHRARTVLFDVKHRVPTGGGIAFDKAGSGNGAARVEQDVQVAMRFQMIELIAGVERGDACDQRMVGIGNVHPIGRDRRVA